MMIYKNDNTTGVYKDYAFGTIDATTKLYTVTMAETGFTAALNPASLSNGMYIDYGASNGWASQSAMTAALTSSTAGASVLIY